MAAAGRHMARPLSMPWGEAYVDVLACVQEPHSRRQVAAAGQGQSSSPAVKRRTSGPPKLPPIIDDVS